MNKKTKQIFKMTALATALLTAYGPALAAEAPVSGSVSVGVGSWSNDRPQGGMYDGMRDSGAYGLLDADLLKRDDTTGTWLGLKARNFGVDNREISLDWLRQGNIGVTLEYSRIPRDQPFIYNTGVQGIGTTTLRVPTPSIVPGSGTNVELGTVRDRIGVKFFKKLGESLNFNASFRNETKDGTRAWGRGGAPEFAVEPIDSTIRIFDAALNYSRSGLQLSGGYYGTQYENANSMVTTSLTSGASPFFLSLPLSNQSHELFLNGGYNFTPTTRGTFKASYSRATQDEPLGTFGGTASPLAPTNLDGKLDTALLEAGITAKPMPKLSIVGNLRYR
ncbi:MAG TPA: MtrB/PioB family outer membrane beta-barrel protein, partial [Burkholderiales bacterium]|nr:MtrB/PioB family outer membrane beta-barrel protein [Burkholderiales bacterium]